MEPFHIACVSVSNAAYHVQLVSVTSFMHARDVLKMFHTKTPILSSGFAAESDGQPPSSLFCKHHEAQLEGVDKGVSFGPRSTPASSSSETSSMQTVIL